MPHGGRQTNRVSTEHDAHEEAHHIGGKESAARAIGTRKPTRRRVLQSGLLLGAGAAAGVGGAVAYDALRGPDVVISADDVQVRNSDLNRDMELTNSTNEGRGMQRLIWSVPTDQKVMALTFDDGPDPEFTPQVLQSLSRIGLRVNFNVMGYNCEQHQDLLAEVVAAGHEIGNHTLTHKDLAFETVRGTQRQLADAKQTIDELTGHDTKLLRPPRGVLTGDAADIAARLGYDVLLWTAIITRPPGTRPEIIREYAMERFAPGHILALHDGIGAGTFDRNAPFARDLIEKRRDEIKALPAILESAVDQGYRFVTVSELMAIANVPGPGAHVPG
jgi:peptidoglycan/xylan/chitin deacetylase (PgdA/CDA1 family)